MSILVDKNTQVPLLCSTGNGLADVTQKIIKAVMG
jgi:hypothetical protein